MSVASGSSPLRIFTDGSCIRGQGAWAFIMISGDATYEESGVVRGTTSLRMELTAVIEALKRIPPEREATVFTDCRILLEAIADPSPHDPRRPHAELFRVLKDATAHRPVSWRWVRAHSGVVFNERCDALCRAALRS